MKKYFPLTLSFLALSSALSFSSNLSDLREDFLKVKNTVITYQEESTEKSKKFLPLYDLSSEKKIEDIYKILLILNDQYRFFVCPDNTLKKLYSEKFPPYKENKYTLDLAKKYLSAVENYFCYAGQKDVDYNQLTLYKKAIIELVEQNFHTPFIAFQKNGESPNLYYRLDDYVDFKNDNFKNPLEILFRKYCTNISAFSHKTLMEIGLFAPFPLSGFYKQLSNISDSFLTAVYSDPLFSTTHAYLLLKLAHITHKKVRFIEIGPGDGENIHQIQRFLNLIKNQKKYKNLTLSDEFLTHPSNPNLIDKMTFYVVDEGKGPLLNTLRKKRSILQDDFFIQVIESLSQMKKILSYDSDEYINVIFMNELWDALPTPIMTKMEDDSIRQLCFMPKKEGKWQIGITLQDYSLDKTKIQIPDFMSSKDMKLPTYPFFFPSYETVETFTSELIDSIKGTKSILISYDYQTHLEKSSYYTGSPVRGFEKLVAPFYREPFGSFDFTYDIHFETIVKKLKEWGMEKVYLEKQENLLKLLNPSYKNLSSPHKDYGNFSGILALTKGTEEILGSLLEEFNE